MPSPRRDIEDRIRYSIHTARKIAMQESSDKDEAELIYPFILQTLLDTETELWTSKLEQLEERRTLRKLKTEEKVAQNPSAEKPSLQDSYSKK
ncbi:MAG TPA: hypothetical protein VNE86_07805 [Nitrososphaerales archaeon]|nr:hypothetical protein [Nitrososphaerales archaeon]